MIAESTDPHRGTNGQTAIPTLRREFERQQLFGVPPRLAAARKARHCCGRGRLADTSGSYPHRERSWETPENTGKIKTLKIF
jgi:hypothetical protein